MAPTTETENLSVEDPNIVKAHWTSDNLNGLCSNTVALKTFYGDNKHNNLLTEFACQQVSPEPLISRLGISYWRAEFWTSVSWHYNTLEISQNAIGSPFGSNGMFR